jgi:hypothetical protein
LLSTGVGANVRDERGRTPLHMACAGGSVEHTRLLLEEGADVNAATNNTGYTPLHMACDHAACVRLLLEAGADANARDVSGRTPLHYAALQSEYDCMRLLLEAGADTNARADTGGTPFDHFCTADGPRQTRRRGFSLFTRAAHLREERGVPVGAPLSLDWTESTHEFLVPADRRLLHRALGALLLVDARREGGTPLGREGALAVVTAVARAAGM